MTLHDDRGMWVKVDGITRAEDVQAAVEAGVSAVGMIFAPSPRRLSVEAAAELRRAVPGDVTAFGVFDAAAPHSIAEIAQRLDLGGVQFPADLDAPRVPSGVIVLRTVRVRDERDLEGLHRLACDAVHLDAFVEGQLGGTGRTAPWELIEAHRPAVPFVLSGGLRPDNVADAVRRLRPAGVDVSSGVETAPGRKDPDKLRAFVEASRA